MLLNRNEILLILLAAAFLTGCSKEESHSAYIARVNNSYLTEDDLYLMADSSSISIPSRREELINDWIEKELIFQQAESDGITKQDKYNYIIGNTSKELAVVFLKNTIFDETEVNFTDNDLEEYYKANRDEFKLSFKAVLFNRVEFSNEDKIIKFRTIALESDWNKAINVFTGDKDLVSAGTSDLNYIYELQPPSLRRIVQELYPQEISIVFSIDSGKFSVVQLLETFAQGSIAPYKAVKAKVENMFIVDKKTSAWQDYLQELKSDNEIEIKSR